MAPAVGGCSFMIHVRHAAAAIDGGILQDRADHARRKRPSRVGLSRPRGIAGISLVGQFEAPFGPMGPPSLFTIPVLRYMKTIRPDARAVGQWSRWCSASGRRESARDVP
jgi:hypothetical protein